MFLSFLRKLRQRLNLHIVMRSALVQSIMQVLSFIISLITIISICCYYGFYITPNQKIIIHVIIIISLTFYILKYLIYLFYSIQKKQYFRDNLLEGIILGILLLQFLLSSIIKFHFNVFNAQTFNSYYILFIQVYFLCISGMDLLKAAKVLPKLNISPPVLMLISYFLLITLGTALLMMPRMTTNGISFINALFTSTSASCITGLNVIDTGSDFTIRGQGVIMILIQLGGLSILTFASFFSSFLSGSKLSLKEQHFIQDMLATNKLSESRSLLKGIIRTTILVEGIGILLLFIYWNKNHLFCSSEQALFQASFHTISAFNNAGFTLWTDSFANQTLINSKIPQLIIICLIIAGGIGFFQFRDIFNPIMIRERHQKPWKHLMPATTIILKMTFIIIGVGTLIYFILEYNYSLADQEGFFNKLFLSCFQVISARTAGFNAVDMSLISVPTLLIFIVLMFIGGAPGSTAGGIKITTAFVIIKSVLATIQGKKRIEFRKRTIPFETVDRSYSIVIMSIIIIMISTFALSISDPYFNFSNILFESVSAFSTCGLSTGITPYFSTIGKTIIIIEMYVGRIGTLTFAFALSKRIQESKHQYPNTYFMVG